jgi:hypothetical protein
VLVVRGADSGSNIATTFLTAVANVACVVCAIVEVVGGRGSGAYALGDSTKGTHTIFGLAGIGTTFQLQGGLPPRCVFQDAWHSID